MATKKRATRKKTKPIPSVVDEHELTEMPIVRANRDREEIRADDFASIYANDTQVQVSPWDVRLTFGLIDSPRISERDAPVRVKEVGEVRLSPQHAKAVTLILMEQLQMYEKRFGIIPMPES